MQKRYAALKSGFTSTWVEAQGHRKPYPGAPITIPKISEDPVVTSVAEVQPRRIIPTPFAGRKTNLLMQHLDDQQKKFSKVLLN